ncbi:hypothetical protein MRBLPD1_005853, partial [Pseudomonas brassicacearum]
GQPPPEPRRQRAEVPLRLGAAVADRNRKRIRRKISAGLHAQRLDPTANRLRRPTHRLRLRPQRPPAGKNRARRGRFATAHPVSA